MRITIINETSFSVSIRKNCSRFLRGLRASRIKAKQREKNFSILMTIAKEGLIVSPMRSKYKKLSQGLSQRFPIFLELAAIFVFLQNKNKKIQIIKKNYALHLISQRFSKFFVAKNTLQVISKIYIFYMGFLR